MAKNQITQTNVTINASYQKAGSFSMSNLNLGFSFLEMLPAFFYQ